MLENECKWEAICPYICDERCMGHKCVCGAKEQMDYCFPKAVNSFERSVILDCFNKKLLTFYNDYIIKTPDFISILDEDDFKEKYLILK